MDDLKCSQEFLEKLKDYKKGDYIKSIVKNNNDNYLIRLLKKPTIREGDLVCKVSVWYNDLVGFRPFGRREDFYILESQDWTSKKIPYMNTALYKILYKNNDLGEDE